MILHSQKISARLFTTLIILLLSFFKMALPSQGSEARGNAFAESLILSEAPLNRSAPEYRPILQEKILIPSKITTPPGYGLFRYAAQNDFLASGELEGVWIRQNEPAFCYVDDGAMALKASLKAPDGPGAHIFRWIFASPGGARAVIEWEYRILSPTYARLLVRLNGGASRGVYGGDPVDSLNLTSGILMSTATLRMNSESLEKFLPGTWSITEELDGQLRQAGFFDVRMLAVKDCSVSPAAFNPLASETAGIAFKAKITALPAESRLFPRGWTPDSLIYRIVALKKWNEGEVIVHRASGEVHPSPAQNGGIASVEHLWSGEQDASRSPLEAGECRIVIQALGCTSRDATKSQFRGKSLRILPVPRITVMNEKGRIIADSEELRQNDRLNQGKDRGQYEPPAWITFIPAGNGIIDALEKHASGTSDLLVSSIYMKSAKRDEKLTITVQGLPGRIAGAELKISSGLQGRPGRLMKLPVTSEEGISSCFIRSTSTFDPSGEALFIGNLPGEGKSFAIFDITWLEDSIALKSRLMAQGWHSRGEFAGLSGRGKAVNARDFMRAAGYETLTLTCNMLPEVKAILHIKNQANLLYYGGHGWGNGYIYLDNKYFHPAVDLIDDEWCDNLEVVIFSSCSVLDIQNYNGRSFTAFGKIRDSPGRDWEAASGANVALLGYNWSVIEGKPPNGFDTRVIRRYIELSRKHSPPVAWIYANILEGETSAPCAIYQNLYYFIHSSSMRILAVSKEHWASQAIPADATVILWPR